MRDINICKRNNDAVHSKRLYTLEVTLSEVVAVSGGDGGGGGDGSVAKPATMVTASTKRVDAVNTSFGIRKIKWDTDNGVALNGQRVELRGVAMHQDLGGLGAYTVSSN